MDVELGFQENTEVINGRHIVKKHVATIHCSNKLSLLERKISNALLYHAFSKLKVQNVHEIKIDELKRLLGANTRNHKALKEALKKLISTLLEWNLLGETVPEMELEGWNASTILSSVSVQRGIIKYQYSELIKTLLIDPKIYGKINLTIQARFKSSYALALYENCSRYRGLPYTKSFDMTIFRRLMGVEDGKYNIFRDFNRRVLNPAITEINTCSDIRILPELSRTGRVVKAIKFRIEERPIKQRIGISFETSSSEVKSVFDMSSDLENLKKTHGDAKVEKAIAYIKKRKSYQKGEIKNVVGYINAAILNDYEDKKMVLSPPKKTADNNPAPEVDRRKYYYDYYRYIARDVMRQFFLVSHTEQEALLGDFLNQGGGLVDNFYQDEAFILSLYKQVGASISGIVSGISSENPAVTLFFERGFSEYLCKKNPDMKKVIFSFENFLQIKNN
ncbi:MAG: replication initiation protein [Coxiellaceae bacterium]|nr:replication initiation protein [Coxiellaceae bacterium]